jgi:hypothetical protein
MKAVIEENKLPSYGRNRGAFAILCGLAVLLAGALVLYAETQAFATDEGFHLLTAQLIKHGSRPYIDFLFPQTPLNAYWNAMWMSVFGETWRTAHALAAVMTAGAILLASDFLLTRFPISNGRLPLAVLAALLIGLNIQVVSFGTIAQAYGFCLFLSVAAFRLAVLSVERKSLLVAAFAGLLAGAAAASSLLTAPMAPVLLAWMLFSRNAGSRWRKALAFILGAMAAFIPVIRLFAEGPRQTVFNVFEYHLFHRQESWEGALEHNLDVFSMWANSAQALLIGLLAFAGIRFVATRSLWPRQKRWEFYLCGWLAVALGVHISIARPTFQRYYLLLVPFLGILAATGLYAIAARLGRPDRPWRAVALAAVILSVGLANALYEASGDFTWHDYEEVAGIVKKVTPPGGEVLADEQVYFLLKIPPPSGMELSDSHKLSTLPPSLARLLHVVPEAELDRRVQAGEFSTLQVCDDDDNLLKLDLAHLYAHTSETEACKVFWSPTHAPPHPASASAQ